MTDIEALLKRSAAELPEGPPADALEAVARRAAEEDLLDVAYTGHDSPVGRLVVAASPRGLLRIAFPLGDPDEVVAELAARVSPRVLEAPARLDDVRRELDEYFDGRRERFDLPIDWSLVRGPFTRRILGATARIGFGSLASYREVATEAGNERAVRAAGNALGSNPIPVVVPCHRVVRTGGDLGGYGGGPERKQFLLELEGVALPRG
jgi:methylated-DNA-[protein]-cysteine S-methyltransferase